jgi:hypothetical protein
LTDAGTDVEDGLASADPGSVGDPLGPGVIERDAIATRVACIRTRRTVTNKHMHEEAHGDRR